MSVILRIPKCVAELNRATAQEAGRYALHGINIRVTKDGKATACATDGRILVEVDLDDATEADLGCSVIVDTKLFKAALAACHAKKVDPFVTINTDVGRTISVQGNGAKVDVPIIEGTFPAYEDVFPSDISTTIGNESIDLNPLYVSRCVLALFKACGGKADSEKRTSFSFHGPKNPVRIDYTQLDRKGRAVIMPVARE